MATLVVYASTQSGSLQSSNATYATARSGGTITAEVDTQFPRIGQTTGFLVWEAFLTFDLSGLQTGDTINSAILALAPNNADDSLQSWEFRARDLDYGATLTTGDWVAGASLGSTGTLRAHKSVASGSWSPNGTYQSFDDDAMVALVTANIGGTIRLIVFSSRTEAGTQPTNAEFRYFGGLADTNKPRLTIDYTPPTLTTVRPDADTTTTGWSTAPLWSKIEETSADGTVITATAS